MAYLISSLHICNFFQFLVPCRPKVTRAALVSLRCCKTDCVYGKGTLRPVT
jgi:hypothetical protein